MEGDRALTRGEEDNQLVGVKCERVLTRGEDNQVVGVEGTY